MARRCPLTGKGIQSGHNVSHANNKTKRRFMPNLQQASLQSDALGGVVHIRLSVNALRTVEHNGGIDAYLLGVSNTGLSDDARRLKKRITKALAKQQAAA
ncbi:50S ribosomal protein L28 [Hypericibacter sp.]|uniref:50S ribosomal protein L28 n=1 Tax=Hypericibacter sp. TaxID=2705401 RepID=UPI003D6D02BC